MLRKFFVLLIVFLLTVNFSFASGEELKNVTKTFKGTVVTAGLRYEETDEWSNEVTPYQDVRIRIDELEYNNIVSVKYQLSYYVGSSIPADELKIGDKVYVNLTFDEDGEITHVEGQIDPIRDIEIINTELILADLEIVENRISKIEKKAETTKDKAAVLELTALRKSKEALEAGKALRSVEYTEDELLCISGFNFITLKKIIYAANVNDEDAIAGSNEFTKLVQEYADKEGSKVIVMCAKLESELSDYEDEERKAFMEDLGLNASGLDQLIKATYDLLGLKTFFTSGEDECRAWTFKDGMKAPECAGIIHTDFQKGFIKAEIMSYEDLATLGSEKAVQEAGKLRLEGKEYIMKDGDICYFRFNVTK